MLTRWPSSQLLMLLDLTEIKNLLKLLLGGDQGERRKAVLWEYAKLWDTLGPMNDSANAGGYKLLPVRATL